MNCYICQMCTVLEVRSTLRSAVSRQQSCNKVIRIHSPSTFLWNNMLRMFTFYAHRIFSVACGFFACRICVNIFAHVVGECVF